MSGTETARCPACGAPVWVSEHFAEWACADPACVLAQSDNGAGGGYSLNVLTAADDYRTEE